MRQCTAVKDAFSAVDEAHRMSVLARSVNVQGGLGNRALSLLGNRALSLSCSLWVRARRAGRARDPPNTRPPRPRPPAPVPTAPCLHRPPSARPAPAHHPEGATRHVRTPAAACSWSPALWSCGVALALEVYATVRLRGRDYGVDSLCRARQPRRLFSRKVLME